MRSRSLAFRLVAGAAFWSSIVLVAGGIILSTLFRGSVERSFDARLASMLDSLIASTDVTPDGHLERSQKLSESRFDFAYSGLYWQIAPLAPRAPLRSRSLFDQKLDIDAGKTVERGENGIKAFGAIGPEGQHLRVLERRISLPGYDVPVSFAVAADRAELEGDIAHFNGWVAASMGVLGMVLLGALLIQVRFGLRPLERVRGAVADIRSGRATRLEGEFPSEIEPLADELNGLLDGNREVLERARTHVGNLAHALKTPLSILSNEARVQKSDFGELVEKTAGQMREQIDHHLARARMAASANVLGAHSDASDVMKRLARTLERIYAERGVRIELAMPDGIGFRGEAQDLEEIAGNLLDNACKWAKGKVRIELIPQAERRKGRPFFLLAIEDDGPGLPAEKRAAALKRGGRLDESKPGSGLGLSIVTEIAELYGGDLKLGHALLGGLRAEVRLPQAGE